jgi:shikimate dehydrogenase
MADVAGLLPATDLLVNCTSLGMIGKPPLDIDLAGLKPGAVVYDIVYVPLETSLLRQARERGHRVVDGLGMLLHQAGYGFGKWFGVEPEPDAALRAMVEADVATVR